MPCALWSEFDKPITENLKFHFYLEVKRLHQYVLFKFPLEERVSFIANIAIILPAGHVSMTGQTI